MGLSLTGGNGIKLQLLQQQLEHIYEVSTPLNVEHFVIDDTVLEQLKTCTRTSPEQLLVHEHDEGLDISLYLANYLLRQLKQDDPLDRLHRSNLAPFCTLLEGISHFLYLVWHAAHARPITQLELELQAEVDKYIVAAALFAQQDNGRIPEHLPQWLFEQVQFATDLSYQEARRYRLANTYAAKYCRQLHRYLMQIGDGVRITRELRRFYRLSQQQKIHWIEQRQLH